MSKDEKGSMKNEQEDVDRKKGTLQSVRSGSEGLKGYLL